MKYNFRKKLDINCRSTLRYLNSCEDCSRVQQCDLPDGIKGAIKSIDQKILNTAKNASNRITKLAKERNALKAKLQ